MKPTMEVRVADSVKTGQVLFTDKKNSRCKIYISGCWHGSRVEFLSVPSELTNGDYDGDGQYRQKFQEWLNDLWKEKDRLIEKILS